MRKTEETTKVKRIQYLVSNYLVAKYQCEQCKAEYIDIRDNFEHCSNCGRKIVAVTPVPPLFRKE